MRLKATEHEEQAAVVQWCRLNKIPVFAIPNGAMLGGRNKYALLNKLKAEGLEPGVPDLFIPRASKGMTLGLPFFGLFIEMKSSSGVLSEDQKDWVHILTASGYLVRVARSADAAIAMIKDYLGKEKG